MLAGQRGGYRPGQRICVNGGVTSEILQEFYCVFLDVLRVLDAPSAVTFVSEIFGVILAAFLPRTAVHVALHDRVHPITRVVSYDGEMERVIRILWPNRLRRSFALRNIFTTSEKTHGRFAVVFVWVSG